MLKKLIRWSIVWGIAFFLLLQGWQLFVAIPLWKLSDAQLQGDLYWSQEVILGQLKLPYGQSIFTIDLKKLKKEVEALPQVRKAKLYRKLPSTLVIDIEESIPWAKTTINGQNIVLSQDGKILNLTGTQALEMNKLIELKGLNSIRDLEPFAKKFKTSLTELKGIFPEQPMAVQVIGLMEIQCKINEQLSIIWGTEEAVEDKIKILKAILPVIQGQWQKVSYIDVRSPKNLAIRYLQR